MRMRSTIGLLGLVLGPAAMAQEAVNLRIGGQPGQFNRYETVVEIFFRPQQMAPMMDPDTNLPLQRMTRFTTRTLTGIVGDTLEFTEVLDSQRMESPAMPQMASMMPQMPAGVDTTVQKMNARGQLFMVDVGNTPIQRDPAQRGQGAGMGRGMGQRFANALFALPPRPVRVGESWSDSTTYMTEMGGTNFLATYTLEQVVNRGSARVAIITVNGTQSSSAPAGSVVLSVSGRIQLDVSNGRLAEMEMNMQGNMNNQQMGGIVPMRIAMKSRLI